MIVQVCRFIYLFIYLFLQEDKCSNHIDRLLVVGCSKGNKFLAQKDIEWIGT